MDAHIFYEHPEYQIIHSHIDTMSYLPLLAAKKAHIPVRIAHSHNTSIDKDFKYPLKQFFRTQITSVANEYCACGQEAGSFFLDIIDLKLFLMLLKRINLSIMKKIAMI